MNYNETIETLNELETIYISTNSVVIKKIIKDASDKLIDELIITCDNDKIGTVLSKCLPR